MASRNPAPDDTAARLHGALPIDAAYNLPLRAAFAYYVDNLSQAEIAEKLQVSRASVHNYLRQAQQEGIVRISLDPGIAARRELADRIADKYGLLAVFIVPSLADEVRPSVFRAAAMWLGDLVDDVASLGVAWGETVHEIASLLPQRSRRGLQIVQLIGSMTLPFRFTAESCTALIADRFGADCFNFHAPAVLSDPALVSALCAEPIISDHLVRMAQCDAALFAIGLSTLDSHIVQCGVATEEELAIYQDDGAAAVIAGRFINADGVPISGPLNGRVIGIDLDRLRAISKRIVVSAGPERVEALRAALVGGFATHLVTDERTAAGLVR